MAGIDNATIIQFSDMVHVEAQQTNANLKPYTQIRKMTSEEMAYDGLGIIETEKLAGRINQTVFADIEHKRRKITKERFAVTLPIDDADVRQILINPESNYAGAVAAAMERRYDRVVVDAMFADVLTGKKMDTSVTFANDGGLTVDATAGLTYEKLLEIKKNFIDNDIIQNKSKVKLVMGITGDEHTDLMGEAELISGDYSRQYVVDQGEVQKAMGIDMASFAANAVNPILPVSGGVRTSFVMTDKAICVGLSKEMQITIKDRPDLVDVKQVQIVAILGAVRTEGKQIQKVTTTD